MNNIDLLHFASAEVFDTLKHGDGIDPSSPEFEQGLAILRQAIHVEKSGLTDAAVISLACDTFEWLWQQKPKRAVLKVPEPEVTRRSIRIALGVSAVDSTPCGIKHSLATD